MAPLRSPATRGGGPLVHGVGFYGSDDEFLRTFTPFCLAGGEQGEPTVVRLEARKAGLLRSVLGEPAHTVFLPHDLGYPHAPGALWATVELIRRHAGQGRRPLRVLGELPPPSGLSLDPWVRYEAAVNHALRDFPVQTLCAYDRRTTPADVRAELLRTHHVVVTPGGGHEPSSGYEAPESFIRNRAHVVRDPMEAQPPAVELTDPDPRQARGAVASLAAGMRLERGAADNLLLAVNEILTNALLHGRRPTVLRGWGSSGRVVVAITDPGAGPRDPFAGLLPVEPGVREGGLGLWITHQLCPETAMSTTEEGFTVRLAAGTPGRPVTTPTS